MVSMENSYLKWMHVFANITLKWKWKLKEFVEWVSYEFIYQVEKNWMPEWCRIDFKEDLKRLRVQEESKLMGKFRYFIYLMFWSSRISFLSKK